MQTSDAVMDLAQTHRTHDKPLPPTPPEVMKPENTQLEAQLEDRQVDFRSSWISINSDSEDNLYDQDIEYFRDHPSAALPPSPFSPSTCRRPRAPTPSTLSDDLWSPSQEAKLPSLSYPTDSPVAFSYSHSPLLRSASEGESSFLSEHTRSFARPPKSQKSLPDSMALLPDPSQYPHPYPFRSPHHQQNLPALSSAGSSSTRSSAYTSSGSALVSGDYGHVHVASGDDDNAIGVGITSDAVVQLLASDAVASSSARGQYRMPVDQTRWSESYSASSRSRSSSIGQTNFNTNTNGHEAVSPRLHEKPSYDMGWQTVDERDEVGMSEEETDDDHILGEDDEEDDDEEEEEEERTSAIVIAEEGRGKIVHGHGVPISHLAVQTGTTHLLIGSSTTPNAMPAFLTNTIPQICDTLLALDISANFLGALPPCLMMCASLEELNIASNPLRVLPVFLADLINLRVLIADATGISTLPDSLAQMDKLHTLSIRRNKLHSLPSWLCLLPDLQTLFVDGNPFQGPWKALVEPLLARIPMTPMYPPSTPMFPLFSAGMKGSSIGTETDGTDGDDLSDPPSADYAGEFAFSPEEEDHTITPERAAFMGQASHVSGESSSSTASQPRGLTRTRTTPNRGFHNQVRAKSSAPTVDPRGQFVVQASKLPEVAVSSAEREVRKMKSAGDLRRGKSSAAALPDPSVATPPRPDMAHYPTSLSSSNLLANPPVERPGMTKRFASLGPSSGSSLGSPSRAANNSRTGLTQSVWDSIDESDDDSPDPNRASYIGSSTSTSPPRPHLNGDPRLDQAPYHDFNKNNRPQYSKDGKEKSRWGFLKKMSMGKMKSDTPSRPGSGHGRAGRSNSHNDTSFVASGSSPPARARLNTTPQIDMRFSTAGGFDGFSLGPTISPSISPTLNPPTLASPPKQLEPKPSLGNLNVPSASSSGLLAPPSPLPRSAKRRSFLPIDTPLMLNIPIPDPSSFVPNVTVTNDGVVDAREDMRMNTPSPVDSHHRLRREEERAREAYMRALRSVMAYLKDMNDLGLSQQSNPLSMYGSPGDEAIPTRSRRPTVVDGVAGPREGSIALSGTTVVGSESSDHLRSSEFMARLRSGSAALTLSVATTDSTGSNEERKFKDDKGKRAMIVREIVETERTYVKGLQELVDIYIKPGSAPLTMLSGVGSSKDTIVPSSERKVVFSGIDALFSFHKESFLPALESAAAPLIGTPNSKTVDADGQLSLEVAKAVGNMFLKHAAFMKMYSSYINNFDNSVQRVKYWTSNRSNAGTSSPALSPASSTAHLAGLGLTMSAVSSPGVVADGNPAATGVPNLSASQKKRIKAYLKRCRMNPRHSQLNLEGYLLLPVQRIPRYRLLLEELLRSTPPTYEYMDDPLDRALSEISSLATNMNEGKRESESRRKLVNWQARIRGKFPSPLVQPHRRLIMDGPLLLTRVVRKATVSFEAINAQGDSSTVQVDCLAPELTPRPLIGILCNDLLVLCRDPSEGQDPACHVDLWAVLRMQTLPQPASIVHGNALRLVDNKAILYFDAPSPSDALNWFRAINLHIPASKT